MARRACSCRAEIGPTRPPTEASAIRRAGNAVDDVNGFGHLTHANQAGAYHHGDLRAALLAETFAIAEGGAASVTMRALGRRRSELRSDDLPRTTVRD